MVDLFMESMKVACDTIFNIHLSSYSTTHLDSLGEGVTIQIQQHKNVILERFVLIFPITNFIEILNQIYAE